MSTKTLRRKPTPVKRPPSVLLGVPTSEGVAIVRPTAFCLMSMISYSYYNECVSMIGLYNAASGIIARNRNNIANECVHDYMLQMDSDMDFPPYTLERFINTSKRYPDAVITGVAVLGYPPYNIALYKKTGRGDMRCITSVEKEPFEVDACGGFGFLVPQSILKKIGSNWFDHIWEHNVDTGHSLEVMEDMAFCRRVREAGFKIICDPTVVFGHVRPESIRPSKSALLPGDSQTDLSPEIQGVTLGRR